MRKLRVLSLFAGIGGFDLGLERTGGFETVSFCEIDPFCRRVLAKHWPGVPIHDDVRTMQFQAADIIVGGFPCQDISSAGKRTGISGERSGLFRVLVRALRLVRPQYAIVENVAALLGDGMGVVLGDMAESGFCAEWDCVSARDVRAPHYRDRVWIVAYPDARQQPVGDVSSVRRRGKGKGKGARVRRSANANAVRELQPGWPFREIWRRPFHGGSNATTWQQDWRDRLGTLCRMDDGVSRRLDEAKPCGNAVVTDIPELIGKAILQTYQEE